MIIYILDKDFMPVAAINSLRTLIWDRRAKEPGMYELHCGASDFAAIKAGKYVYRQDRDELGIILERDLDKDKRGARTCYAKGYFAEYLLFDRVIEKTYRMQGTPEEIGRALVARYFIRAEGYEGRSFEHIVLGTPSNIPQDSLQMQATGKPVGTAIASAEDAQDIMHRLRYDPARRMLAYTVSKGENRNAVFSDEYANIRSAKYHEDGTDAPNVVYVAGAGEGEKRKVYRIDMRESQDEYAREMYVDARDLQQSWEEFDEETGEYKTKYYTDEDYDALLEARGMEKLAAHKVLERFDISADADGNLVYLEDYDVGDWCYVRVTVSGKERLELERQITSIRETYEAGKRSIAITFGDYGPRRLDDYVAKSVGVNEVVPSSANGGEDLSGLDTEDKATLVRATNEVNKKAEAARKAAGDVSDLDVDGFVPDPEHPEVEDDLTGAANRLQDQVGHLDDLQTDNKGSLVDAINELAQGGGGGSGGDGGDVVLISIRTGGASTAANVQDSAGLYNRNVYTYDIAAGTGGSAYLPVTYKGFQLCMPSTLSALAPKGATGAAAIGNGIVRIPVRVSEVMGGNSYVTAADCMLGQALPFSDGGAQYIAMRPEPMLGMDGRYSHTENSGLVAGAAPNFMSAKIIARSEMVDSAMLNTRAASRQTDNYEAWPVFSAFDALKRGSVIEFKGWAEVNFQAGSTSTPFRSLRFVRWLARA